MSFTIRLTFTYNQGHVINCPFSLATVHVALLEIFFFFSKVFYTVVLWRLIPVMCNIKIFYSTRDEGLWFLFLNMKFIHFSIDY